MGWALRTRWLWLQKTDHAQPWEGLPVHVPRMAHALFAMAVVTEVGRDDRWINGSTVVELAPNLIQLIPKRDRGQRTVSQALNNRRWISNIQGALTMQVLVEYLRIWGLVDGII